MDSARTSATPGARRAISAARGDLASTSWPAVGLIWIVTSRETSPRQSCEALVTRIAPPAVRQARNVMIAMTMTSARPAIELGRHQRHVASERLVRLDRRAAAGLVGRAAVMGVAVEYLQSSIADDEAARIVELVHQRKIMGRDDDRGPGFVQFDEEP